VGHDRDEVDHVSHAAGTAREQGQVEAEPLTRLDHQMSTAAQTHA
jgi:hypothetical protein